MEMLTDNQYVETGAKEMAADYRIQKMVKPDYKGKTVCGAHMGYMGKDMNYGGGGKTGMAMITWLAMMALLVAMTRYFWKKAE